MTFFTKFLLSDVRRNEILMYFCHLYIVNKGRIYFYEEIAKSDSRGITKIFEGELVLLIITIYDFYSLLRRYYTNIVCYYQNCSCCSSKMFIL